MTIFQILNQLIFPTLTLSVQTLKHLTQRSEKFIFKVRSLRSPGILLFFSWTSDVSVIRWHVWAHVCWCLVSTKLWSQSWELRPGLHYWRHWLLSPALAPTLPETRISSARDHPHHHAVVTITPPTQVTTHVSAQKQGLRHDQIFFTLIIKIVLPLKASWEEEWNVSHSYLLVCDKLFELLVFKDESRNRSAAAASKVSASFKVNICSREPSFH